MVSVIIVNYGRQEFIDRCIHSLNVDNYRDKEIILIDTNVSKVGPAVGRNIGARTAKGEWLLFLDNDTEVKSDAIEKMTKHMHRQNDVMCTAHLLRASDGELDSTGDYLNRFGFLVANHYLSPVFSVKTAACMVNSDVFKEVGGFDESYYMYLEDTDLAWRVNKLYPHRVGYCRDAIVYHAFDTTLKHKDGYDMRNVRYNGCRNYITTHIKNLSLFHLFTILPLHVMCWVGIALLFVVKGKWKDGWWVMCGIAYNAIHFKEIYNRRSQGRCIERDFIVKDTLVEYIRKISSYIK